MKAALVGTALFAALAVLIGLWVWGVEDFGQECVRRGGEVETRFEGYLTIYVNNVPQLQPQYSYHCWVGDREVTW